jgi:hypothetical protein
MSTHLCLTARLKLASAYEDSYNETNQMYEFLKFIFGIKLFMFRTVPLSIIRSFSLYT